MFRQALGCYSSAFKAEGGREVWFCPNFPANCINKLVTGHKEQLTSEIHHRGMDWHGIRIWIVALGPEELRQKSGDGERCCNLLKVGQVNRGRTEFSQSIEGDSRGRSLTVTQKNRIKNTINKNGISSHPTPANTAKNTISMGSVTNKSVPMTSLRLGFLLSLLGEVKAEGRVDMTE